jgi:hypothetical protein
MQDKGCTTFPRFQPLSHGFTSTYASYKLAPLSYISANSTSNSIFDKHMRVVQMRAFIVVSNHSTGIPRILVPRAEAHGGGGKLTSAQDRRREGGTLTLPAEGMGLMSGLTCNLPPGGLSG